MQSDLSCDVCGYSRRGIAAESRCPECGEPPPRLVSANHVTSSLPLRTLEEQHWLRSIALGLWLLIIASIGALQVALVLPVGSLSIGAINFPGPKVDAASMIQRSIIGQPGPWGVAGTLWTLATAMAVWLITERRTLRSEHQTGFPLRGLARWVSVISVGAMAGLLLSGRGDYLAARGAAPRLLFVYAVGICELPANLFLYAYLRHLAGHFQDRRATATLNVCAWAVPIVIAAAAVQLFVAPDIRDGERAWRIFSASYGAAALATGIAATATVIRLAAIVTPMAFGNWIQSIAYGVREAPWTLRRVTAAMDANGARWSVVAGLLLWLSNVPANLESVLTNRYQRALSDVPMLNFPNPKINLLRLLAPDWPVSPFALGPVMWNLFAVWLMTRAVPRTQTRFRRTVRLLATIAIITPLGLLTSVPPDVAVRASYATFWSVLTAELPATFFLYLYLASLAAAVSSATRARTLRLIAWASVALFLSPLLAYVVSGQLRFWHNSLTVGIFSAAFITTGLAITLMACSEIVQLAWSIARPLLIRDRGPAST